MATSTWEGGFTLPDEQAEPEDTATPSKSKAISGGFGLHDPAPRSSVVLGSRSTLPMAKTITSVTNRARMTGLEQVTKACLTCAWIRQQVRCEPQSARQLQSQRYCRPHFRYPRAGRSSWPPPLIWGSIRRSKPVIGSDDRRLRLSGRRSCAKKCVRTICALNAAMSKSQNIPARPLHRIDMHEYRRLRARE